MIRISTVRVGEGERGREEDDSLSHSVTSGQSAYRLAGYRSFGRFVKHEQCASTLFNINVGYACIMSPDIYIADHACATRFHREGFIIYNETEAQIFFLELILNVVYEIRKKGGRERSFGSIIDEQTRGKGYLL